jgi:hypothetical protein
MKSLFQLNWTKTPHHEKAKLLIPDCTFIEFPFRFYANCRQRRDLRKHHLDNRQQSVPDDWQHCGFSRCNAHHSAGSGDKGQREWIIRRTVLSRNQGYDQHGWATRSPHHFSGRHCNYNALCLGGYCGEKFTGRHAELRLCQHLERGQCCIL